MAIDMNKETNLKQTAIWPRFRQTSMIHVKKKSQNQTRSPCSFLCVWLLLDEKLISDILGWICNLNEVIRLHSLL